MATLKPLYERAAFLLAEGWKHVDVAREVGVTPASISRWMHSENFLERIGELSADLTAQSVELLRDNVLANTRVILEIAQGRGDPALVNPQLKAALWAVEKVLKVPDEIGTRRERLKRTRSTPLANISKEEAEELLKRGTE